MGQTPVNAKYLDLFKWSSGGIGTEINPYGYPDLVTVMSLLNGVTLYIKGIAYVPFGIVFGEAGGDPIKLVNWLPDHPWTLRLFDGCVSTYVDLSGNFDLIKGGIIECGNLISTTDYTIRNSIVNVEQEENSYDGIVSYANGSTITIEGSTIIISKFHDSCYYNVAYNIKNSVINADDINANNSYAVNSVFTSDVGAMPISGCQLGWTAPVWPSIDATEGAWRYNVIGTGININNDGNISNYPTGLWGNPRGTKVGGFSFGTN